MIFKGIKTALRRNSLGCLIVCFYPFLLSPFAAFGEEKKPSRILSLNLCTDYLVEILADPKNISSLTFLSSDPKYSLRARKFQKLTKKHNILLNHNLSEEVLRLKPDVIFTAQFSGGFTANLLEQKGYNIIKLKTANTFAEVRDNIRIVAQAIGENEKGQKIIAQLDKDIQSYKNIMTSKNNRALLYQSSSIITGRHTLGGEIIHHMGFRNIATELNIPAWGQISYEQIVLSKPDYILMEVFGPLDDPSDTASLASEKLLHPIFKKITKNTKIIGITRQEWSCGTPSIIRAMELIKHNILEPQPS
jgi:iron complex transport system substrate-binding protein